MSQIDTSPVILFLVRNNSIDDQEEHDNRYHNLEVPFKGFAKLYAFTAIYFCSVVVKSPSVPGCTEKAGEKGANRQQQVTNYKVLQIHNGIAGFQRLDKAEYIKSKGAWYRTKCDYDTGYICSLFSLKSKDIN